MKKLAIAAIMMTAACSTPSTTATPTTPAVTQYVAVPVTQPAKTKTVTATVTVKPKITATQSVSRSTVRQSTAVKTTATAPKVTNYAAPGGVAACIRKYESGGNYRAVNASSGAGGAYQFMPGTWRAVTGRSDLAQNAPASVQDAAFYKLWAGGAGARNWVTAYRCI